MKKYILFFVAFIAASVSKAQSGYNYAELCVGLEGSYMRGYTNVPVQFEHAGVAVKFIYNYSPYLPIEAEIQKGTLSGGGLTPKLDKYGRQFTNNYLAVVVHADFQLGAGIDYEDDWFLNIVKNFYAGTGVGVISNSNKVQRTSGTYVFPGKDNSIDLMIPIRAGYEFKIYNSYNEPSFAIDLGYIHTVAFGEGLDGYNDPPSKFKNNALDQYRQITLGVKYYFGRVVSYNKLIRPFR